jgi:hypothetical protein
MGKVRGELEDLAFRYTDPGELREGVGGRRGAAHRGRAVSARRGRHAGGAVARKRHRGARGVAHQAPLLHLSEDRALQGLLRPGLRPAGDPRDHAGCGGLLCGLRADSHAVAAGAGAHQGLHRHSPRQPLPVAAHHGDGRQRAPVRSADPHRRDAPHRRGRHCGALEVQGRRRRGDGPRRGAAELDSAAWSSGRRR